MTRTERLLSLLQILRSYRYPVSGHRLAERLNVSIRTLYRDIQTLQAQGAEIQGEAGSGYVLKSGYFIPPLMFSETEVESIVLGMQWVKTYGDRSLSRAADNILGKIREVLPAAISSGMGVVPLRVGPPPKNQMSEEDLSELRSAIRRQRKLALTYPSKGMGETNRIIWPFAIGYFSEGRILVGWSEKEKSFCHFRTAAISRFEVLEERYSRPRDDLFQEWQKIELKKVQL